MLSITKILIAFLFPVIVIPANQVHKGILYGTWTSDKPLYNAVMKLSFEPSGKYVELTKDAKTNKIKSRLTGTYKMINDSTIRISSKSIIMYHKIHFMNRNLLRFYSANKELKESIPLLYAFNFVRRK